MSISAIIITYNEEKNISQCLESLNWVDEIIVVDSGSSDKTAEIAKKYTNKVYHQDWLGFGKQKAFALSKASKDWVLSIDADEVVSNKLQDEIKMKINASNDEKIAAYNIPFQSYFLGKAIKYGDWKAESHIRLFKIGAGKFDDAKLHENLIISGEIASLNNYIHHYSYANISEVLDKLNRYSSVGAQARFDQGKRTNFLSALLKSKWAFIRTYLIKKGFLDGKEGLLLAQYISAYTYYRYLKLAELRGNK